MNTSQVQLLGLLAHAINEEVSAFKTFPAINGEELFNLALQQNVSSFLYPTINKCSKELNLDNQIMRRWQEATLYMATRQISMINEIRTILDLFETNGISTISLKGLVLKQLYPQPELRNMGDIDLLIHEEDIQKSIELLGKHGYQPNSKDLNTPRFMHIVMQKIGTFPVELHKTLLDPKIMKNKVDQIWLDHIWHNKRFVKMQGLHFNALSIEDELINLVVHLARHVMEAGAQLRQLCDFALFYKFYRKILDFEYIEIVIQSMDLYKFYLNLLSTCHLYLKLPIPPSNILEKNNSETLINLIWSESTMRRKSKKKIFNESSTQFENGIEVILKNIPYLKRTSTFVKRFKAKANNLRSVGLYIKY